MDPDSPLIQVPAPDNFHVTSIGAFVTATASLLLIFAGITFFILLVWGGLQWLSSEGDPQKLQAARAKLTAALIGLALIALTYAITMIIEYFYGIPITVSGPNSFVPVGY